MKRWGVVVCALVVVLGFSGIVWADCDVVPDHVSMRYTSVSSQVDYRTILGNYTINDPSDTFYTRANSVGELPTCPDGAPADYMYRKSNWFRGGIKCTDGTEWVKWGTRTYLLRVYELQEPDAWYCPPDGAPYVFYYAYFYNPPEQPDPTINDLDGDGYPDFFDCNPNDKDQSGDEPLDALFPYLALGIDNDRQWEICNLKGDPVSILNGNHIESETDLNFTSPFLENFSFKRYYNSQSVDDSSLGLGWTHSFNIILKSDLFSSAIVIVDATGFGHYFGEVAVGVFSPLLGNKSGLTTDVDNYIWTRTDGSKAGFNRVTGLLDWIEDQNGNRQNMVFENGVLAEVIDTASNRSMRFSYTDGRISAINLYTGGVDRGQQVAYTHDLNGNLTGVAYPDGSGWSYAYNDPQHDPESSAHLNNMTAKTDGAGHVLSSWTYDDQDRCVSNETVDDRGVTIDYDSVPYAVIITDAYGMSRTYHLGAIRGKLQIISVDGTSGCPTCTDEAVRIEHDDDGNVIEKEYANGRIDQFADFDARGNAGTVVRAVGSAEQRTTTYTWHPILNQPLTRTEQSVLTAGEKVTIWDYDDDGNAVANENPTNRVGRIIVSGFSADATGAVVPVETVTAFVYNARGQVVSVDGPVAGAGDTTAFGYDATTGDLLSINRPVSGSTTFSEYDAAGRPGRSTDPNLNSMAYTYDGRGRVSTITRLWDSAETGFTYTTAGKVNTVTLPNGTALTYAYDPVGGRLTGITDALGNRIGHGYDNQGNIVETGYYLLSGIRTFQQRFDYQYPGRPGKLWKAINPDDSYHEYGYDAVGNLNQHVDPEGRITSYGYDLLNRQVSITQPGSVTTQFLYDGQDHPVLVTDAESRVTEYVVDDLDRTVTVVSPDTGTTRFTYDAAGNPVSRTDANGITSTYAYDDECRLTAIHYPDSSQDVAITYDQGANGKGRMTGMTDAAGTYAYGWDEAGNRISEQKIIDGIVYTTGFAYDEAGLPIETTYPDGTIVTWRRDAAGNVDRVSVLRGGVTTIFADAVGYLPFGPMQAMTLGNGITVDRSYDALYRMTGNLSTGIQNLDYGHDLLGHVTGITDALDPTRDLDFDYDALYRLTDASGIYGIVGFSMDDTGNRLSRTQGGLTETYAYATGTSLLDQIVGSGTVAVATDAAGNTTAIGTRTFAYDQANRLIQVQDNGITLGAYATSADGRRIKKTVDGTVTVYHYDDQGRLIAESDGLGILTRLYIHLNGEPLALITMDGETEGVYYYHNDHLGTPQRLTDAAGTIAWAADYLPFGGVDITTEAVENNLRFPGQYYDGETGLHYNYHRYYDPATGRYLTPDPIGLAGGINLFSYVQNNPVNLIDPLGLQPPQNIPPSVNLEQNVREAQSMSSLDFYNAVKSGGKWDYKIQGKQYEDFGNYNFGMTGRATGFSEDTLKRGAGAYQIYSGTSNPQWGWPWGNPPYGDDPRDQRWIEEGVNDFEDWRDSPCP